MKARLLSVDLNTGKISKKLLNDSYFHEWIGGRGLAAKLLSEEKIESIKPLEENNVVILASSPLVGLAPGFNRLWLSTISPLTNYYTICAAGGYSSAELRKTGFDAIKIKGAAKKPIYLEVTDKKIKIHDASKLWGKTTDETRAALHKKHKDSNVICIGPAGENGVLFATVQCEDRSAARGGPGTVLGSKKLKAIVLRGSRRFPGYEKKAVRELDIKMTKKLLEQKNFGKKGTLHLMDLVNTADGWPTKNWRASHFKEQEKIDYPEFEKRVTKRTTCFKCPIACVRYMRGKYVNESGDGPEYETIWAFGPECGNADADLIIAANRLCDKYGLDTISCGATIGFFKECCEKKIYKYKFDSNRKILDLIKHIAYRDSAEGELLSGGSRRAGELLNAGELAIQQCGMEIPAYDPRAFWGMLLTYTMGARHGCHLKAWTISPELQLTLEKRLSGEGKAELVNNRMNLRASLIDSVSHCSFLSYNDEDVAALLSLISVKTTVDGLKKKGSKIVDLERKMDIRRGHTKDKDTLPKRLIEEPITVNGKKVIVGNDNFERMKKEFYALRGW